MSSLSLSLSFSLSISLYLDMILSNDPWVLPCSTQKNQRLKRRTSRDRAWQKAIGVLRAVVLHWPGDAAGAEKR